MSLSMTSNIHVWGGGVIYIFQLWGGGVIDVFQLWGGGGGAHIPLAQFDVTFIKSKE